MPSENVLSPRTDPESGPEATRVAPLADAVRHRYGGATQLDLSGVDPAALDVLDLLYRHRSVRRFADTPVSPEVIEALIVAAQSASSSSHNQCWSVIEVRDRDRIQRLVRAGRVSAFAAQAPVLLLFVADWARAAAIASWAGESHDGTAFLETTLVGFVDAAIAAQNASVAAEALGLGVCYLGSMRNEPEVVAQEVGLPPGSAVALGLAIGYPRAESTTEPKPRLPLRVVHHREQYEPVEPDDVDEYGAVLQKFYDRIGRDGGDWAGQVIARVRDAEGLHGRARLREQLGRLGLPSD